MKRFILTLAALLVCTPAFGQRIITHGATDQTVYVRIINETTGVPETGVTSATSGIDLEYVRVRATVTDLTESDLAAVDSAHSDGGIKHVGGGVYRVDVPDAAFASGVSSVIVQGTITGMTVIPVTVQLTAFDLQTATQAVNVTQLSGDATAADNAELFFDGTGYAGTNNVIPTVTTLTGHTAQTGDAFAIVNSGTHGNAALKTLIDTIDDFVDSEVGAIKTVTDQLTAAQAEPGQGAPAANATPLQKLGYLYKAWRNKKTQTGTLLSIFADDGTTVDHKATVSDSSGTTTVEEVVTGP